MKIRVVILFLMIKAGITTGLCSDTCHDDLSDQACHIEMNEHNAQNSPDDSNHEWPTEDGKCHCSCCHIASFVKYHLEIGEKPIELVKTPLPQPTYHWTASTQSVFRPPCS